MANGELEFNTLSNPRGSKVINMMLADGSRVWLNAGSSITYPVAFVGNKRNVNIDGEAYFEIAHDASTPFIVSKGDMNVTVLGTHFNVNAYDDENDIKVTLLEGSVNVSTKYEVKGVKIKPGEQAIVNTKHEVRTMKDADVEQVIAWKNGYFNFKDADIVSIMRQVEKWYDVEVVYEQRTDKVFIAEIPRTVNAGDFFKILEATGWVRFKIEGKKITVLK
jgi:ferric-dicitrate binding protein FerR (iron transport regulator)